MHLILILKNYLINYKMIKLNQLLKEETFTATNKSTGKTSVFKSKDSRDAAIKAGTHDTIKDKEQPSAPKAAGSDMFGGDYTKNRGGEAPKSDAGKEETPKYDLGVDSVVYNKRTKTVGIVRLGDERGETKTDADGNVNTDELEPYNPMKFPYQKDAQVAPSTSKEIESRKLFNPFSQKNDPIKSEPKNQRKGNPQVNKEAKKKAEQYGITPQKLGNEKYKEAMLQAAVSALTDSNFHSEARELVAAIEGKPEFAKKPEYPSMKDPKYKEKMADIRKNSADGSIYMNGTGEIDDYGTDVSQASGWDGVDAADSIAFTLRMNGFHKEADLIQSVFDNKPYMKNEGTIKLTKLMENDPCWKGYKQVGMKDKNGREVPNCVPEGIVNEQTSYAFGKQQYTQKTLTPSQILDLATAYVNVPNLEKIFNGKLDNIVNVANDLARLNGTIQLDAKTRGKKPALILSLLNNKLISKDDYVKLYRNLIEKQILTVKRLKNADPASRMIKGAAARQAYKDMKGEFDETD
jgi:hypothetical protein